MPLLPTELYCGLETVFESEVRFAPHTLYFRPNWRLPRDLNRLYIGMIEKERNVLLHTYGALEGNCSEQQETADADADRFSISVRQMQGAFWSLMVAESLALLVLLTEILQTKILSARVSF